MLIVSAIVLTFLLFLLPKIVVENDQNEIGPANADTALESSQQSASTFDHGVELDENLQNLITDLREKLNNSGINEKSITFVDSLVILFRRRRQA